MNLELKLPWGLRGETFWREDLRLKQGWIVTKQTTQVGFRYCHESPCDSPPASTSWRGYPCSNSDCHATSRRTIYIRGRALLSPGKDRIVTLVQGSVLLTSQQIRLQPRAAEIEADAILMAKNGGRWCLAMPDPSDASAVKFGGVDSRDVDQQRSLYHGLNSLYSRWTTTLTWLSLIRMNQAISKRVVFW